MRVAALYDIHGNLPALEAVLRGHSSEQKSTMSWSEATCCPARCPVTRSACLSELDIPVEFIRGNGDRVVLAQMARQGYRRGS